MDRLDDKVEITNRHILAINAINSALYDAVKPYINKAAPIFPLLEFIIERLVTVTTLTTEDRLWDAEIVLRSASETLIKFVFITSAEKEEQETRIDEYWNLLSEINSIKQSEQAKKNLKHLGHLETHRLAYLPNVLPEDQETKLREKWPKVKRQKLEQKWSFSEMIASLSKNYRGGPMEIFMTLAHSYRMASHVTHGDETGILIIRERNSRTQEQQEIANFAHYLRLLSDSFNYCFLVAIETMTFLKLDINKFIEIQKSLNDIQPLINKYHSKLFEDDIDYDKYRTPTK